MGLYCGWSPEILGWPDRKEERCMDGFIVSIPVDYKQALTAYADTFRSVIETATPVDTGFLKSSISCTYDTFDGVMQSITLCEYAEYVEYGTWKMAAQPYFEPAVDEAYEIFIIQAQEAVNAAEFEAVTKAIEIDQLLQQKYIIEASMTGDPILDGMLEFELEEIEAEIESIEMGLIAEGKGRFGEGDESESDLLGFIMDEMADWLSRSMMLVGIDMGVPMAAMGGIGVGGARNYEEAYNMFWTRNATGWVKALGGGLLDWSFQTGDLLFGGGVPMSFGGTIGGGIIGAGMLTLAFPLAIGLGGLMGYAMADLTTPKAHHKTYGDNVDCGYPTVEII